ncbi:LPXTG cell wall anchor domain-containing protein [Actinoplanes sp. NPDC049548]|uniref:LPXTG cell wall anchor domain-containing protein n=1 Tax=Actinoplanes sp. NPDC049548 TaxID=3155152 RepID=UPI00341D1BF9
MANWFRRGMAAAGAAVAGVLVLAGPAAAAPPPAQVDERLLLYNHEGQAPVAPGGSVTFVMTAAGIPEHVPQHRTVVLELPEGVTFRAADNEHAAGPCVPDATRRKVTCTTQDPVDEAPATNAAWWVTTDFADDLPLGEYVTAKATLSTELRDPDPSNNVSSTEVFVTTSGNMSVTISAPPGPWPVGSSFDATFRVHNDGPYRSPADMRTVVGPDSLSYTGWPKNCLGDPGAMYCTTPVVEAGETYSFTVRFKVTEFEEDPILLGPEIYPTAPDTNPADNKATYRADIIKAPTSPSPSATPSPTPTDHGGAAGGEEPTLPITGAPAGPLALTGLGLLVAGAGAVVVSRRRRV